MQTEIWENFCHHNGKHSGASLGLPYPSILKKIKGRQNPQNFAILLFAYPTLNPGDAPVSTYYMINSSVNLFEKRKYNINSKYHINISSLTLSEICDRYINIQSRPTKKGT